MRLYKVAMLALAGTAFFGCNTLRLEVADAPVDRVVEDRHDYWIWGGFPSDVRIDLHEACPNGTVAIEESIRPRDAAVTLLTLTVWSPRTATYSCRAEDA